MRQQEDNPEARNQEERNNPEDVGSSVNVRIQRDERGHCIGANFNSKDGVNLNATFHKVVS